MLGQLLQAWRVLQQPAGQPDGIDNDERCADYSQWGASFAEVGVGLLGGPSVYTLRVGRSEG